MRDDVRGLHIWCVGIIVKHYISSSFYHFAMFLHCLHFAMIGEGGRGLWWGC